MNRHLVLLYPEDVPAGESVSLPAPTYLEVSDDSQPDRVRLRSLIDREDNDAPAIELWLQRHIAFQRMVWAGEARMGAPGSLLRRPVVVTTDEGPIYGQVVAYTGTQLSVRHPGGVAPVAVDKTEEVAPALVFLLARAQMKFRATTRARSSMASVHATILDRLLGLHGASQTRSIRQLLAGFVPVSRQPKPSETLLWCSPTTGEDHICSVQHVVDFGYSVDGGATLPANVVVGESVFADPAHPHAASMPATVPSTNHGGMSTPQAAEFADLLDSLDSPEGNRPTSPAGTGHHNGHGVRRSGPGTPAHGATHVEASYPGPTSAEILGQPPQDLAAPVQIMSVLAAYPDLLRTYADQIQRLGSKRQRTGQDSVSDFIASATTEDASDRQGSFRPSNAQRAVHDLITAEEHRGKSPATFVEYATYSPASKFIPHPAIFARLFDVNFEVCELSVLHFRRFGINAQLEQSGSGSVNMRNFSVKVALPKVTVTPCFADIVTALRLLNSYANEFFDGPTRRLFATAQEFAEELNDYGPWTTAEARALAFWFSRVLGSYRLAAAHDAEYGTATRLDTRHRLCMQDAELNGVLLKLSRFQDRRSGLPPVQLTSGPQRVQLEAGLPRQTKPSDKSAPRRSVPSAVALVAPRENGKQLCLRFISAQGCPSPSPDRCTHHFLGHFVPSALEPVEKAFVVDKYGGLRADVAERL